ncbi:kinesin-like protein KIF25 [Dendronephthya gigantea]|uniref:kinesin-like protein KIF25 n=1 Tax=Dendronephthya gigantea TaxID=151771 RepID=UPI0010690A55|nr:kinesin-like protein KIF25 [Dendronephthya gigantea]
MPEFEGEALKERVQKLERVLRAREERIVALETENAMLYLKLADCQGSLHHCKSEASHLRRLYQNELKSNNNVSKNFRGLSTKVTVIRKDMENLSEMVRSLPKMMEKEVNNARLASERLLSGTSNLDDVQAKLLETEMALDEALQRASAEKYRRRTLHNVLVELRGNIRVHCRVRPLIAALDSGGVSKDLGKAGTAFEQVVNVVDDETVSVRPNKAMSGSIQKKIFEFERVYAQDATQEFVFEDVSPLLTSLLDGYNVCFMAYGQTGSGKTHTMVGGHTLNDDIESTETDYSMEGIIPRAAREIFRLMAEREHQSESYAMEISVCEIYNNDVRDLLSEKSTRTEKKDVYINSDGSTEIPSLSTRSVRSVEDVMKYVGHGMRERHEDATKVHAHSSRSHLIVQLTLYTSSNQISPPGKGKSVAPSPPVTPRGLKRGGSYDKDPRSRSKSPAPPNNSHPSSPSPPDTPSTSMVVKTKLQLVDLAGSECVGLSGVTGSALRETSFINKSLSALADVLGALAGHRSHIPYRNTKLTHVLQDTIGGDAKLLVMLCVSPVQKFITETMQCLGFGSRARQVARGQVKKRRGTASPLQQSIDLKEVNAALKASGSLSKLTVPNLTKRRGSNH